MFYSHTFLAKKGPLGTVWCAAHLQHKLKKSHYISTNVQKTAELIMCPEVPIALRMSGHLLLGVVRIYSKQVDYLYEACNEIRITINRVITTVSVNLPNDATHAPVHSITLPEKFNLDAMELDDFDWDGDSHLKNKDDITLTEQIPTGNDPYIVFSFDEHDLTASQMVEDDSGSGAMPMEEDAPPIGSETAGPDVDYPSPSNKKIPSDTIAGHSTSQSAELQLRAPPDGFDFKNSPVLSTRAPPDKILEKKMQKDNTPNRQAPEVAEEVSPAGLHHSSPDNLVEQHSSGHIDFGGQSIEMEDIRPSPAEVHQSHEQEIQPIPPAKQERVRRNRKRKLVDESIVLTNIFMSDALNDTSDIRRVKRNCPLTSLAIWKQNNRVRLRKEGLFAEPFITGISADLQGIYMEDSAKHHIVSNEAPQQETNIVQSPLPGDGGDNENEILRNNEFASPILGPSTFRRSPSGGFCFTPGNSIDVQSGHLEMTGNEISPTVQRPSGNLDSEIKTPDNFYGNDTQAEDTVPELVASPGELGFLEQDDNSPDIVGSQGTPATGDFPKNNRNMEMSSRTRAVAQFLERQSLVTPILGNSEGGPPEDLSLNKILQGKTRKVCARMFYETLVLKSHGLVDAQQERPYGDITLKVTPKLSKGKFPA